MKQLTPEVLREATELITELCSGRLEDEQLSGVAALIVSLKTPRAII
jgi:hypothetical protein